MEISGQPPQSKLSDPRRLAIIRKLGLLDTPPEAVFDQLTRLAATLIGAPIAMCSIISGDKQFFKSAYGLTEPLATTRETPLSHSFCQHVVLGLKPLIVADAREDDLLKDNPAVTESNVISYAGIPLLSVEGEALGSFCVIDTKPREWTPHELAVLKELAALAMREFQLRDASQLIVMEQQARQELTNALVEDFSRPLDDLIAAIQSATQGADVNAALAAAKQHSQLLKLRLNDVIDVAQLHSDQMTLKFEPIALDRLVNEAIGLTRSFANARGISIESHIDPSMKTVLGDREVLGRVVSNVIRHAVRFTDRGSVVFVLLKDEGENIRCSVSDTGMGLSDEAKKGMFSAELPYSEAGRSSYAGLGLTYCRVAVEAHNGAIGAASQEGVGTTIWFSLPVVK